ncbi:MAG TPA: MgtC/SapB family protein [Nitrospiraceae bacterium]|nr:MgtC/SapB family protein [Nitrospiraceae bacterium]
MTTLDFSIRIIIAVLLGAGIGIERQWHQRQAGLRTNALVSIGAAAFVSLSEMFTNEPDPTRIAAQVASGIGFLGAGVILRDGLNIRGLNTAATLWCSAAVGTLIGAGFITAGVISAVVIIGANVALRPLSHLIDRQPSHPSELEICYSIQVTCLAKDEQHIRTLLLQTVVRGALLLKALESAEIDNSNRVRVQAELITTGRKDKEIEEIAARLGMEPDTTAISWKIVDKKDQ